MPSSLDDKLGAFQFVGLITAGGIGDVYTARDQRAGTRVAIKVVKGSSPKRFRREARVVAMEIE